MCAKRLGAATLRIERAPGVLASACVAGKKEGEGPLKRFFDYISPDAWFGEKSWEKAESTMLRKCFALACDKADIAADDSLLEKLREHVEALGYPLYVISAAAHQGVRELVYAIAGKLKELPPVAVYEPEYVKRPPQIDTSAPVEITVEDGVYLVEGPWLERLISNTNFGDYESRMWFDKMLREAGVFQRLEELGIQDGDLVSMYSLEFEYQH